MPDPIRVKVTTDLTTRHNDLVVLVAKALKAAGAPVSYRLRSYSVIGWWRARAEYVLVVERGVISRIINHEPGVEIFEWSEA